MEFFRSSGTSGGLIHGRTTSAYLKARCAEFLQAVGRADAYAIATGRLRQPDVDALRERIAEIVSESWLERHAEDDTVEALSRVTASMLPEAADRAFSNVLRARFPEETRRPELNSRWG